jgi:hypothetical protein
MSQKRLQIKQEDLEIGGELGFGSFGMVFKGVWKRRAGDLIIAVKKVQQHLYHPNNAQNNTAIYNNNIQQQYTTTIYNNNITIQYNNTITIRYNTTIHYNDTIQQYNNTTTTQTHNTNTQRKHTTTNTPTTQ